MAAELREGATVGRFVIVRPLGSGGMGTVYEARDPELSRSVAVKLLREPDRHLAMRLLREAQALAKLQHPNVVTVYELGLHDDQVFVAMELVDGESLDRYFARGRSSWRSVVAMFLQAARGLAAAHAKGLVHRDVKPANLFVDEDGRVRVGDFGLARLERDDDPEPDVPPERVARAMASTADDAASEVLAGATHSMAATGGVLGSTLTRAGAIIGTPLFMAPEQLNGRRGTAASDQFSFCVAMWRALFGEHPFDGKGAEIADSIATGKRRELATRRVPRWLVRALERGLAQEPAERHPSMAALVRVFERGISRRRAVVAGVAATFAIVVAFSAWRIIAEMRRADAEAVIARERADAAILAQAETTVLVDPTAALALVEQLSPGAREWQAARTIIADAAARGIAHVLSHRGAGVLALSADGSRLASAGEGSIRMWDLGTWTERTVPGRATPLAIAFAGDALISVDLEGNVDRIDAAGSTRVRQLPGAPFQHVEIQPGGRRIAVFDVRSNGRIVDLAGSDLAFDCCARGAWSPDGQTFVMLDRRVGRIVRVDLATGALADVIRGTTAIRIATDGPHVWTGTIDGKLADVGSGQIVEWASGHIGSIAELEALPDGTVASVSASFELSSSDDRPERRVADYTLVVSDSSPYRNAQLRGHGEDIVDVAVAPTGRIASLDTTGSIRVWTRTPVATTRTLGVIATAATLAGDGRTLAIARRAPYLEIRDLAAGTHQRLSVTSFPPGLDPGLGNDGKQVSKINGRRIIETIDGPAETIEELMASASGRRLVTLDSKQRAIVWDLDARTGAILAGQVALAAISPAGDRIVTAHADTRLRLWDPLPRDLGTMTTVTAMALAPDGAVAAADGDGDVILFAAGGRVLAGPKDRVHALAFSPDGKWLAGGGKRRWLEIWNLATGAVRALRGHTGSITHVVFSPDGSHVAAAATDGSVRVWDLATDTAVVLRGHTAPIRALRFRADGRMLVTASDDHDARLWDLATATQRVLPGSDLFAGFTADGKIVSVDRIDGIALHLDDLPTDEAGLRAWLASKR
ncbi:MAG: protein kinase [Kofleriaceae bacterium]